MLLTHGDMMRAYATLWEPLRSRSVYLSGKRGPPATEPKSYGHDDDVHHEEHHEEGAAHDEHEDAQEVDVDGGHTCTFTLSALFCRLLWIFAVYGDRRCILHSFIPLWAD